MASICHAVSESAHGLQFQDDFWVKLCERLCKNESNNQWHRFLKLRLEALKFTNPTGHTQR